MRGAGQTIKDTESPEKESAGANGEEDVGVVGAVKPGELTDESHESIFLCGLRHDGILRPARNNEDGVGMEDFQSRG